MNHLWIALKIVTLTERAGNAAIRATKAKRPADEFRHRAAAIRLAERAQRLYVGSAIERPGGATAVQEALDKLRAQQATSVLAHAARRMAQ